MTSRVDRREGHLHGIIISCDEFECDAKVDDKEVEAGGGLREMCWQVRPVEGGLRHYCPAHHQADSDKE